MEELIWKRLAEGGKEEKKEKNESSSPEQTPFPEQTSSPSPEKENTGERFPLIEGTLHKEGEKVLLKTAFGTLAFSSQEFSQLFPFLKEENWEGEKIKLTGFNLPSFLNFLLKDEES